MANKSTKTKVPDKIIAIGRRKSSTATATIVPGNGEISINRKAANVHFPLSQMLSRLYRPLEITSTKDKYNIFIHTSGGGQTGQLDSTVLAIARGLVKINPEFKTELRKNGLLTRDSRERQRRHIGTGGKARRQKQSPKR
jgi:small subunit ribosomal protein S9